MLRYYQAEAVEAVFSFLREKQGNPLVVLPTGAGKSHVIREIARRVTEDYGRRLVVLQHRKELIEQNAAGVIDAGMYSAGLGKKEVEPDVVFAGIQSCYRKALEFGRRHLVIIDEAHLVADEGMFQQFISDLQITNPDVRLIGLTATPYRTSEGHLIEGKTWSGICYEAPVSKLIDEGYLSPLTSVPSAVKYETDNLRVRAGEFVESDLQLLFDDEAKIDAACQEVLAKTSDRRSVLVFCSGVTHAHHVAERLGGEVIHGETTALERAGLIESFRAGRLRYLCNCDVLTTGFDAPNVDAVVLLRATMSPGLLVQMAGRGFRLANGKHDCLILDFGQNIKRHGPLDAIDFGKRANKGSGQAAEKSCPGCDQQLPAGVRVCECGFIFPEPELRHEAQADEVEVLAKPQTLDVKNWSFTRHTKKEIHSLRVTYHCGVTDVDEWVCPLHDGIAGKKAAQWVDQHCEEDFREIWMTWRELEQGDVLDCLQLAKERGMFRQPTQITVRKDGKYHRVIGREFGEIAQEEEVPF